MESGCINSWSSIFLSPRLLTRMTKDFLLCWAGIMKTSQQTNYLQEVNKGPSLGPECTVTAQSLSFVW